MEPKPNATVFNDLAVLSQSCADVAESLPALRALSGEQIEEIRFHLENIEKQILELRSLGFGGQFPVPASFAEIDQGAAGCTTT